MVDIQSLSDKITYSVIEHFRHKANGRGYFYLEQEFDIMRKVRKILNEELKEVDTSNGEDRNSNTNA